MTLSPKTQTSNSRFWISLFKMFLLGLLRALTSRAQTPMMPQGAGFTSSFSGRSRCTMALSLLGLWWLLAAVLPLGLRLALLRDLVGMGRGVGPVWAPVTGACCPGWAGWVEGFLTMSLSCGMCEESRGARWPAPAWLAVVTVILDTADSGWDVAGPLAPPEEAMRPETLRCPVLLLLSLPLAEAAELGAPRAEAKLCIELTLNRLLPSTSEKEDLAAIRRAGSGRNWEAWSAGLEPGCRRGVSKSSVSVTVAVPGWCSKAKSRGEDEPALAALKRAASSRTSEVADSRRLDDMEGRGPLEDEKDADLERGGGIDRLAGSAWVSVVFGSAWRPFRLTTWPAAVVEEDEERLCDVEPARCGGLALTEAVAAAARAGAAWAAASTAAVIPVTAADTAAATEVVAALAAARRESWGRESWEGGVGSTISESVLSLEGSSGLDSIGGRDQGSSSHNDAVVARAGLGWACGGEGGPSWLFSSCRLSMLPRR